MLKILTLIALATPAQSECPEPRSPFELRKFIYDNSRMRNMAVLPMAGDQSIEIYVDENGLWAQLFIESQTQGCLIATGKDFTMVWPLPRPDDK